MKMNKPHDTYKNGVNHDDGKDINTNESNSIEIESTESTQGLLDISNDTTSSSSSIQLEILEPNSRSSISARSIISEINEEGDYDIDINITRSTDNLLPKSQSIRQISSLSELSSRISVGLPVQKRKCTDPFCFVILILTWCLGIGIGLYAFQNGGDPRLILYPVDYKGNKCGYDVINNTTLPSQWYMVDYFLNGICLKGCPNETILDPTSQSQLICKDQADILRIPACEAYLQNPKGLIACGACMYSIQSTQIFDRCIPVNLDLVLDTISANGIAIPDMNWMQNLVPALEKFMNDLSMCKYIILTFGVALTSLLGYTLLLLIRCIPTVVLSIVIWGICLLSPILLTTSGILCFTLGKGSLKIISYILFSISFLLCCVLIFIRRKLHLAIAIMKTTSNILNVSISLYPILLMLVYCVIVLPWIVIMLYLSTCTIEGPELMPGVTNYVYSKAVKVGSLFILFIFYWTSEYILALSQITLAINYTTWYFSTTHQNSNILNATLTSILKHSGTAAYGGLIVALVKLFRSVFMSIHKKLKDGLGVNHRCIDVIFCCCSCCIFCVEKCLKYIDKNAYVQTAVFGYPFCKAAQESFSLIVRHASRMVGVGFVGELILSFCKLAIVSLVGITSFFVIEWLYGDAVSIVGVVLMVCFIAWFIASIFLGVVSVAISTILQCFLMDEEMYPEGSIYVPMELLDFMDRVENFKDK